MLSERERVVIQLAAEGLTDKEIAVKANLRITTVRTYWERIRTKTGAKNKTHAVCLALGCVPELPEASRNADEAAAAETIKPPATPGFDCNPS